MSVTERMSAVDRRTLIEAILSAASLAGVVSMFIAAAFLYSSLTFVILETFRDVGVQFTTAEQRFIGGMFEVPLVAALGALLTHAVNVIADRTYKLRSAATVAAGGYSVALAIHVKLLSMGVL